MIIIVYLDSNKKIILVYLVQTRLLIKKMDIVIILFFPPINIQSNGICNDQNNNAVSKNTQNNFGGVGKTKQSEYGKNEVFLDI